MHEEFYAEHKRLPCNYGMGIREMLVLLKAYAQYKADELSSVLPQDRGWIKSPRAVASCFNRFGEGDVIIPTSFPRCSATPNFWENKQGTNEWRLTKDAIAFVDQNKKLYEAAKGMLKAVMDPMPH